MEQPHPLMPQRGKPLYELIAAVVIFVLAGSFGWYVYNNHSLLPVYAPPATSTNSSATPPSSPPASAPVAHTPGQPSIPTPNATVMWRGDGVQMSNLGLIAGYKDDLNPPVREDTYQPVLYYDMGIDGLNKIILAKAAAVDPSGPAMFFFEQKPTGYAFMAAMSSQRSLYTVDAKQGYVFSSHVTATDTTTFYNDVIGPERLNYRGLSLYQSYVPLSSDLFSNYVADEQAQAGIAFHKIDSIASGDVYVEQKQINDQLAMRRYLIMIKSGLFASYSISYPFISDDLIPHITWSGGMPNNDSYRTDAALSGCGNPGATIVPLDDISARIHQTGATNDDQAIYEFKNQDDPLVKYFYDLTGGKGYNPDGTTRFFTLQEFWNHHAVILYKNGLGDYVIFTSNTYGIQAECGKPVIYLYPTQTTLVRVQVGADITVSEPAYNNGWNVEAQPDGTITTADGRTYDSLYWEGIGQGNYPAITEGTIVPRSKVAETLKAQLAQLGLSEKESADFLAFWMPKMPDAPYTRLTWFTTSQMNELAPLVVWPHQDTTIRVFLDFQALENPVALQSQHLTAVPRRGFTLVEWGGLLRK